MIAGKVPAALLTVTPLTNILKQVNPLTAVLPVQQNQPPEQQTAQVRKVRHIIAGHMGKARKQLNYGV